MSVFTDFPEEIISFEEIDVGSCVLEDNKTTIDVVAKQIWGGNKSLLEILIKRGLIFLDKEMDNECEGIKDILYRWREEDINTFVFYIPKTTIKEIRKKLSKKVNIKVVSEKLERYIATQSKRNLSDMSIYNLDDEDSELANIFDISALKKEFDNESKGSDKIFFMGLKYNLGSREANMYLNGIPIPEESGLVIGNSKILRQKLKKGYMGISADGEDITIEFFDTNKFTSTHEDIVDDLNAIDFEQDSLDILLEESSIVLKSNRESSLIFSSEGVEGGRYEEDVSDEREENSSSMERTTNINMTSFFIPKDKGLNRVSLLLLDKNGQKIIAGGQYHSGLSSCAVLAELSVDFKSNVIVFKNHSDDEMAFSNFEDSFWRLEESGNAKNKNYNSGIFTEILSSATDINEVDGTTEIRDMNIELKRIESGEEHIFKINQLEFNDSHISFDNNGVWIRYSSFCIAKFKKEFKLHRTAFRMSDMGTIIDCFVRQLPRGGYEYGGKIYDDESSKILGITISSRPIVFRHIRGGLEIDASALIARGFHVQITVPSNKYLLTDRYDSKKIIKKNEMRNVEIEIINKSVKKPLIEFTLEFD